MRACSWQHVRGIVEVDDMVWVSSNKPGGRGDVMDQGRSKGASDVGAHKALSLVAEGERSPAMSPIKPGESETHR